jgi:hypothetical protein
MEKDLHKSLMRYRFAKERGIFKCQHCACSYSPELKKGRYVYMRPTKSKGECSYCYHLNENAILSEIEDVLKGMKIPQHIFLT